MDGLELLVDPAPPGERNAQGDSNLHIDVLNYRSSTSLRRRLELGAHVDAVGSQGFTPLHLAVLVGHRDALWVLLQHGANPNAEDRCGNTPLHWAALANDALLAAELMEAGAYVLRANMWGDTPLALARNRELKELLVRGVAQ